MQNEHYEDVVCGHCGKDYDHESWMQEEKCCHCGEFLDNPPYVLTKDEFNAKTRT